MAKLLLGKEVTDALNGKLQERTAALREKGVVPTLAIVRCGANPSDLSYERGATKRAALVGVNVVKFELPCSRDWRPAACPGSWCSWCPTPRGRARRIS